MDYVGWLQQLTTFLIIAVVATGAVIGGVHLFVEYWWKRRKKKRTVKTFEYEFVEIDPTRVLAPPKRRAYYIDVGSLPRAEAEEVLEEVKERLREKHGNSEEC